MHNLADSLMSGANPIFDFIVVCLNFLSIFVIVWGVLIAGIDFVRYELTEKDRLQQILLRRSSTLLSKTSYV